MASGSAPDGLKLGSLWPGAAVPVCKERVTVTKQPEAVCMGLSNSAKRQCFQVECEASECRCRETGWVKCSMTVAPCISDLSCQMFRFLVDLKHSLLTSFLTDAENQAG